MNSMRVPCQPCSHLSRTSICSLSGCTSEHLTQPPGITAIPKILHDKELPSEPILRSRKFRTVSPVSKAGTTEPNLQSCALWAFLLQVSACRLPGLPLQ